MPRIATALLLAGCLAVCAAARLGAQPPPGPPSTEKPAGSTPGDPVHPLQSNENAEKGDTDNGDKKDEKDKKDDDNGREKRFSVHGQNTMVMQGHLPFHSPYSGPNSLTSVTTLATSDTSTLFLAGRLWRGAEVIFNPEIAGGTGFNGVHGVAGFPNGEITRVGVPEPTPYIARLNFRQTIGLGGPQEEVEDGPNQIAKTRDINRITFAFGKMAATDFFDNNKYSNDPRTQFLNWSLMFNGAWDYPANVRGYTYGMISELNLAKWAFRHGIFLEPAEANGADFDPKILKANGNVWEFERRYEFNDHPGKARFLMYLNAAHMGNYREAIQLSPVDPDITQTRAYRAKYGFCLNFEQEITKDLGAFLRAGWNDGHTESWAFTEIDRTLALGLLRKGTLWRRPEDEVGTAVAINGLSQPHADYLAAGGLGFILGDGRLNYAPEVIWETYYAWQVRTFLIITTDFQYIFNPGYNADRGPVAVGSLRVHLAF